MASVAWAVFPTNASSCLAQRTVAGYWATCTGV